MKSFRHSALTTLILGMTIAVVADEREERLSDEHRKWLKEEVVYIITEQEKDVFLSLETEEQRNLLIDAFWEKRDPYPATFENEFKTEHYRRIEHANEYLSRDAPMPGWRTDRGEYYIILGEPISIQRFDGLSDVVSSEIWYYNGDPQLGLPSRFNLLFFRDYGVGHYELYDPINHGPPRLLRAGASVIPDPNQALDVLELVSIDLAIASVTVDLTEMGANVLRASRDPNSRFFRPSMSNNYTMANIVESPKRRLDTEYLEGYLRYGERVDVEYSFRFIRNRFYATVLPGPDNTPFVHFIIEIDPENFSVEGDDEGRFHTTLDIGVEVRDLEGKSIALANTVPIEISASQLQQVAHLPFAYEDDFPLAVPGSYKMSVTLRNRFTKQFTVAEAVSGDGSGLVGGKLSLKGVVGGRYRLRARLVDPSEGVVVERSGTITVSPRAEILRAGLVYREGFRTEVPGLLPLARGQQLLVTGHIDEAIAEFQESVDAANPQLPMAKWKLANALLYARQADRALEILLPLEEQYANEYDVVEGLGLAYYLRDEFQAAIPHLETAMGIRAPDITVLNALGSCYRASGRNEEAKTLFRRSLELKSDQPAVQEWLAAQGEGGGE